MSLPNRYPAPDGRVYLAYGLRVASDVPLPEIPSAQGVPDVRVRMLAPSSAPVEMAADPPWHDFTSREAVMGVPGAGTFHVTAGRDVTVVPACGADEALIRLCLLGPVLAALLYQRGYLVLHASAVAVDGIAVAFLGESGAGKSTIAAALHALGCPLVADDVLPVELSGPRPVALPGFPWLKVGAGPVHSLGLRFDQLAELHPRETKRGWRADGGFAAHRAPLGGVYSLRQGETLSCEPIHGGAAVIELVRHAYPTRLRRPAAPEHLRQCAQLAGQVPIRALTRSSHLASLPDLVELVQRDIAAIRSESIHASQ